MSIDRINTVEDHDNFIQNNDECIMYFGSQKCPNCRIMDSVLNQVVSEYPNIKFSKVEVTNTKVENLNDELPILVCYKNNKPVGKVVGSDRRNIVNLIENNFGNVNNEMVEINTSQSLNKFTTTNKKCIIFFGSQNCHHCRNIKPYIDEIKIKYPYVSFSHIEVTSSNQKMIPEQCKDKDGNWGLPLIVCYKNNQIANYVMGADQDEINNMIKKDLL